MDDGWNASRDLPSCRSRYFFHAPIFLAAIPRYERAEESLGFERHFLNKPTEPQESTPEVIELPGTPAAVDIQPADAIHPVQFGIFPKRLTLPYTDDEFLSGYEEDALSIRDRYTACVKEVPDATLEHHLFF